MQRSRHSDAAFRYRYFDQDIIALCVRWYIAYRLSYRDLVETMAEWSVSASPSMIYRWLQHFVPEFENPDHSPPFDWAKLVAEVAAAANFNNAIR